MKKKYYWIVGIVVILMTLALIILILSSLTCIGCGTQFVFGVKEGCDIINQNKQSCSNNNSTYEQPHCYEINFTDKLLDSVIVEYGYPASGLKTSTLREFCQYRHYKNIEDCEHDTDIASICR